MSDGAIVLAISGGYLALSLVVGILPGRRASSSAAGYVAGDRGLGLLVMYFITGATIFSAFAFLGAPGWAYSRGAAAYYVLAYGTLGFVPFYFVGPRAARLGRAFGFVTQAEMVAHRFRSRAIAGVMALASVVAFVPYLALQMRGAGYVLETVTAGRIPVWAGAGLVYAVVTAYVLWSGVLGVGWTNTLQGVFMMVLAWVLGLWLPRLLYGGVGPMFDAIESARPELLRPPGLSSSGAPWSWGEYTSAVLVSAIGFSFWPHLFMKAFSARSDATLRRTVVLYPTFQLFIVPILLIGFAGVLYADPPARPDQILPHLVTSLELPPVAVGLFCAGALAASMSSGDAIAHATASIAVRDGWQTALGQRSAPAAERRRIRIAVVAVIAAAYTVAVRTDESLVSLLLYAYGPVAQFAPPVLAVLYLRRVRGAAVLAALAAGTAVALGLSARPDLRPWPLHAGLYGLAVNSAVLLLLARLLPQRTDPEEQRFLAVARGEVPAVLPR